MDATRKHEDDKVAKQDVGNGLGKADVGKIEAGSAKLFLTRSGTFLSLIRFLLESMGA